MMVIVNPGIYHKYVTYSPTCIPMLYVLINKSLYGLVKSVILFYEKLSKDLKDMEFVINPYNPCVANKMIQGH